MSPLPHLSLRGESPGRRAAPGAVLVLIAALIALAAAALSLPGVARAGGGPDAPLPAATAASSSERWPPSLVDYVAYLPVQDGGRVKPLETYAGFLLLRLNHKRSVKDLEGNTLSPLEWLLDLWFRPDLASRYKAFRLDTYELMDAIGLEHEGKKKADWYAYADFVPGRDRLRKLASEYARVDAKDRSPVEGGVVDLEGSVRAFEDMIHLFDWTRASLDVSGSAALRALFGGGERVTSTDVFAKAQELDRMSGLADEHGDGGHSAPARAAEEPTPDEKAAQDLLMEMTHLAERAAALAIVPPAGPVDAEPAWFTPGHLVYAASRGNPMSPEFQRMLEGLTAAGAARSDTPRVEAEMRVFGETSQEVARSRGETRKLSLEVSLFRLDPFYRSVWLYVFAFLVLAVSWLVSSRWVLRGAWALLLSAVLLHATGIVIRCILRGRPPISTLYETALFISAVGAIGLIVAECINRRGIALAFAPIMGGLGLFVANTFEAMKGEDTLPQLEAVLDTNFWLATHVTCVTIGYSGGLLAALVAHVQILGRAFGLRRGDDDFYRTIGRMTYGMTAFGLVFSVLGTILGGVWANDSWGRFWGWDPKENGALMICLAQLALLHARMGGHVKTFGFAMGSIGVGCVVAFSWWGVNLLGIGLHSYGFTSGILTGLLTFGAVEAATLLIGAATLFLGRASGQPSKPTAA